MVECSLLTTVSLIAILFNVSIYSNIYFQQNLCLFVVRICFSCDARINSLSTACTVPLLVISTYMNIHIHLCTEKYRCCISIMSCTWNFRPIAFLQGLCYHIDWNCIFSSASKSSQWQDPRTTKLYMEHQPSLLPARPPPSYHSIHASGMSWIQVLSHEVIHVVEKVIDILRTMHD